MRGGHKEEEKEVGESCGLKWKVSCSGGRHDFVYETGSSVYFSGNLVRRISTRQTDRQTDRQTARQRKTDRQTDRLARLDFVLEMLL